jgi:excisionase family DNA binding protein
VSLGERLYEPDRVIAGTSQAIERARARGAESIEPDDLLVGLLLAVARFGIVDLGSTALDLTALGLRFDLPGPDVSLKPRYTAAAAAVFDRAARVARGDGAARIAPIHLLAVLGDPSVPAFARITAACGLDAAGWRRALAALGPPADGAVAGAEPAPRPRSAGPGADRAHALEGLLSPDDAARALGVHIQTVRGYIRDGRLPAFRVAGERAIRLRRDDVAALLESMRVARPAGSDPAAASASARNRGRAARRPVTSNPEET